MLYNPIHHRHCLVARVSVVVFLCTVAYVPTVTNNSMINQQAGWFYKPVKFFPKQLVHCLFAFTIQPDVKQFGL